MINGPNSSQRSECLFQLANGDSSIGLDITGVSFRKKFYNGEEDSISFTLPDIGNQNVLIRVQGPALSAVLGSTPVLSDPVLGLYRGTSTVAYNDNWWTASNKAAIITATSSIGLPPFPNNNANSNDAAMLVNLAPGTYEISIWGGLLGSQTDGEMMIEVYIAP